MSVSINVNLTVTLGKVTSCTLKCLRLKFCSIIENIFKKHTTTIDKCTVTFMQLFSFTVFQKTFI